ncbi:hypothetical protein LTR78_003668 [Recurvomyces mirabilis]|uniref:Major facilitator superfamily (MFS) profile domain-containing protein n=1 Tax=Recurvomyces mirabilis TaxID=574656 RepID=A0AAE1C362_9PEZI|nr:hypothetical protein LTR78_003668 [Recurvomyces mirabilis]KAK5154780.1 hypothetical protein LTS14_006361 [Recurvomyces mirabilis]
MRKRLAYGFYAMALQQMGGIAPVTMYATYIYMSWDGEKFFIVQVNTFTVDKFGRRQLLITGFAIQAIALLILSSLTTSFPHNTNKAAAVVEIAMLFIVGLTYCWSDGPPAIASEIFSQHVRDKAFGISLLGQTSCLLAITQPWPQFIRRSGQRATGYCSV